MAIVYFPVCCPDHYYCIRQLTLGLSPAHRFLFQGDGKAVSEPGISSRPRSSVDMGLPSSYQRLCNGYQYPSGQIKEVDSGFKDSLLSHSVSPAQNDTPPPIRLDKHPSFRKQRSTMSPSESFNGGAFGHSVGSLNEDILFNERATSQQSVSPPDEGSEESGSGQFPRDPDPSSSLRGQRSSEEYMYVTMTSPHVNVGPQEEYVMMVSAPVGSAGTLAIRLCCLSLAYALWSGGCHRSYVTLCVCLKVCIMYYNVLTT